MASPEKFCEALRIPRDRSQNSCSSMRVKVLLPVCACSGVHLLFAFCNNLILLKQKWLLLFVMLQGKCALSSYTSSVKLYLMPAQTGMSAGSSSVLDFFGSYSGNWRKSKNRYYQSMAEFSVSVRQQIHGDLGLS